MEDHPIFDYDQPLSIQNDYVVICNNTFFKISDTIEHIPLKNISNFGIQRTKPYFVIYSFLIVFMIDILLMHRSEFGQFLFYAVVHLTVYLSIYSRRNIFFETPSKTYTIAAKRVDIDTQSTVFAKITETQQESL